MPDDPSHSLETKGEGSDDSTSNPENQAAPPSDPTPPTDDAQAPVAPVDTPNGLDAQEPGTASDDEPAQAKDGQAAHTAGDDVDHDALLPDEGELTDARSSASEVLNIVGVARVICVDDDFNGNLADLKTACELLQGLDVSVSCLSDILFTAPQEVWSQSLDHRWDDLSPTERGVAIADAREKAGLLDTDQLNAGALWSVLADPIEFIALSPAAWIEKEATYLEEAEQHATLVLFDKELGEGYDGLQLATSLYAKDHAGHVWAGLFTHTTTIQNEHATWAAMVQEPGVVPDRFVVLAKQHLGPEPATFPQALKVALMTRPASVLRRAVTESIRTQVDEALNALDSMSPAEFERLVFGLSSDEGQWEVDMLLRLFDAFLRSEVRQALHDSLDVRQAIVLLRRLSKAATLPTADTTNAQQIYRRELYEEASHLNALSLPIELGDVFCTPSSKHYVIVAQPCDLMVRSGGRRQPDLQFASLVQIFPEDPNAPPDEPVENPVPPRPLIPTFELPAFSEGKAGWARLDRAFMVPMEALDFCVFDPEGQSVAPTSGGAPDWILPGWAKRHETLAKTADSIASSLTALHSTTNENKRRIAASYYGRSKGEFGVKLDASNRPYFALQRVARLRSPYARAILTRYTAHVSRDAFERAIG